MSSPVLHWSSRFAEVGLAGTLGLALAAFAIGRTVLAFLPAGRFAEHGSAAWSVGFILGCGVLIAVAESSGVWIVRALWITLGVFALAAGLRAVLGPHALTPGRAIVCTKLEPLAFTARVAAWATASIPIWREPSSELAWLTSACLCASANLQRHGLICARQRSLASELASVTVAAVSLVAIERDPSLLAPILAISVSSAAVLAWWRRADRRALALAAFGFALSIRFAPTLGLAGTIVLVMASAKAARGSALKATLAAVLLPAVVSFTLGPGRIEGNSVPHVEPSSLEWIVFGAIWALAACGVLSSLASAHRLRRRSPVDSCAPDFLDAENGGLALFLTLGGVCWFAAETIPWVWADALASDRCTDLAALLAPAVIALGTLSFVPPERA